MVRMRKPEMPLFENVPPGLYVLEIRWITKWRRPEPDEVTEKALVQTQEEDKAVCVSLGALPLEGKIEELRKTGQISQEGRVSRITSALINTNFYNPETGNWLRPWRDWIRPILGMQAGQLATQFIEDELEFPLDWLLGMRFRAHVFLEPRIAGGFWSRFGDPAPSEEWEEYNLRLLQTRIADFKKQRVEVREEFVSKEVAAALRKQVETLLQRGDLTREQLNEILDEISGGKVKERAKRRGVPLAEALLEFEAELLSKKLAELSEIFESF